MISVLNAIPGTIRRASSTVSMNRRRVYRRTMRLRTRSAPDWAGRCSWAQTEGSAAMTRRRRSLTSFGWGDVKRTRLSPRIRATAVRRSAKSQPSQVYEFTVCPSSVTSLYPCRTASSASTITSEASRFFSGPRT